MLTDNQARLIAEFKSGQTVHSLPINAVDGILIGRLAPITDRSAKDQNVIAAICEWRKAHMTSFLTVFEPSLGKTEAYLHNVSLADPGRILFLVCDAAAKPVGNIGLCNVKGGSAEMDNVIRGEMCSNQAIMTQAQRALLRWTFFELGVALVYLNVLANNTRAIRAYRRVGFTAVDHVRLTRKITDGGYQLIPAPVDTPLDAPELVRMEMTRQQFDAAMPAVAANY